MTPWIHTCLPRNDSASCRSHTSFVQEVLLGAEARNLPLIQIFWTAPTTNTNTDKNKDTNIFSAILLDRLLPQHSVRNLIIITGFRNLIIITGLRRLRSVASRALRQIHAGELNLDQPSVALINVPTIRGWCELVSSRWWCKNCTVYMYVAQYFSKLISETELSVLVRGLRIDRGPDRTVRCGRIKIFSNFLNMPISPSLRSRFTNASLSVSWRSTFRYASHLSLKYDRSSKI